jgi:hypothetical protein
MPGQPKDGATPTIPEAGSRTERAREVVIETYGVRVAVRAARIAVISELLRRLAGAARECSGAVPDCTFSVEESGAGARILAADALVAQASGFDETCAQLESNVSLYVAEHAPEHVFLHSGCVAFDGRAVLVPGRSFSGKTTLVTAFLRAGGTYYSDEYAVVDGEGRVFPFPRLLSVRRPESPLPAKVPAADFGAPVGVEPVEVACVVHTTFAGSAAWRPRRLSPGRITMALLDNAVPARSRPGATLRAIRPIAERAIGLAGPRGDADAVVERVLRALERV